MSSLSCVGLKAIEEPTCYGGR